MNIEGTYTFRGPREAVWDLLHDPDVLARAMPGTKQLERTADDRYEGTMKVSLGPVGATFSLVVALTDQVHPDHFSMAIDAKGTLGFARGTARIVLEAVGEGDTLMRYTSDLQIGGRLASIGQRVVDGASRTMTERGLAELQRLLDERLAARGGERA